MLLKICSYVQIYVAMSKEPTVEEKDQAKGSFPRGIMQSKKNVHKHFSLAVKCKSEENCAFDDKITIFGTEIIEILKNIFWYRAIPD